MVDCKSFKVFQNWAGCHPLRKNTIDRRTAMEGPIKKLAGLHGHLEVDLFLSRLFQPIFTQAS